MENEKRGDQKEGDEQPTNKKEESKFYSKTVS